MGNRIIGRESADGSKPSMKMNNGLTSVVVSILSMAASARSSSESQRRLASAITTRDQSLIGIGTVGFNLCELPWDPTSFSEDRDFLVRSCDRAGSEVDWHRLDYQPNVQLVKGAIEEISALLGALEASDVIEPAPTLWGLIPDTIDAVCDEHKAFLHRAGCVVCNDR